MKNKESALSCIRTKDIIDIIKANGYCVKITHYRYFGNKLLKNADIRVLVKAMKIMNSTTELKNFGGIINNRGGRTSVKIEKNGCIISQGFSDCSTSDVFNYSKASRLALYRAINTMPKLEELKTKMSKECLRFSVQIMEERWKDVEKFIFELGKEHAMNRARQIGLETGKEFRVIESFE
mgnify:CR=1 FL=1